MKGSKIAVAAAAALTSMGCASPGQQARYMAGHFEARAELRSTDGGDAGAAVVKEADGALRVTIDARGLPAGTHGAHVHMVGKCESPGFASAGGHWNPSAHQHGSMNPMGPHLGDLPNLEVAADGTGHLEFTIPAATLAALLDEDGAALVIHAAADDLKTDPSGNSGARIACGVLGAV